MPIRSALLASILICAALPLAAQEYEFTNHGGTGTPPTFDLTCGTAGVLVGVSGFKGQWLDQLTARCVKVESDGDWSGSPFTKGPAGAPGGTAFGNLECPNGSAVASVSGRYGWYIHSLSLACYDMGSGAQIAGASTKRLDASAPGGDQSWSWELCPDAKPAKGFRGRAGIYIDKIQLVCHSGSGYPGTVPVVTAAVVPAAPQLISPPSGTTLTGLRPTFTWAYTARASRYQICVTRENGNDCGMVNSSVNQGFSGTYPIPITSFRPAIDLNFGTARRATWSVRGCSAAGCGPLAVRFWLNAPAAAPPPPPPPPAVSFATDLAPTFKSRRCTNCHAVVATDFARSTTGAVGLPDPTKHITVNATMNASTDLLTNCQKSGCHTNALLPTQGTINPGWHAPPSTMDLRGLSDAQLCEQRAKNAGSVGTVLQHLTQDKLILWAFEHPQVPRTPVGELEKAPPSNITTWQTRVQNWVNAGMPCN